MIYGHKFLPKNYINESNDSMTAELAVPMTIDDVNRLRLDAERENISLTDYIRNRLGLPKNSISESAVIKYV